MIPDFSMLPQIVAGLSYKPCWHFWLESGVTRGYGSSVQLEVPEGLRTPANSGTAAAVLVPPVRLVISAWVENSLVPGKYIRSDHLFGVPELEQTSESYWRRWVLERILDVERHEACEFFAVEGIRCFYPAHGPDVDLYAVFDHCCWWNHDDYDDSCACLCHQAAA